MAKYDLERKDLAVDDARVAIVAARFNDAIVSKLLTGALEGLAEHRVVNDRVSVVRVPGAFEIPLAAARLAAKPHIDGVVTLGAVVRGDTPHFDYVAGECAAGVSRVALDHGKPIIFGVLTVDNDAQALARAGGDQGNKGHEAALAVLEMISLLRRLD